MNNYSSGLAGLISAEINWVSDTVRAILVNLAYYTPDFSNDSFLSDVPVMARVATSSPLTSKTYIDGVGRAGVAVFGEVVGPGIEAVVVYSDHMSDSESPLIAYLEFAESFPPMGKDINVAWPATGIFDINDFVVRTASIYFAGIFGKLNLSEDKISLSITDELAP